MIRDYAVAFEKARLNADLGDPDAQADLATMYSLGLGCNQDNALALLWYRKAAAQGQPRAQSNLGFMYGTGRGVPQDYMQAYAWYNLAAASGERLGRQNRDVVAKKMSSAQLERAQDLSRELFEKIERGTLEL